MDDAKLDRLRARLVSMFERMDEMGLTFHPWVVEDAWVMAEILGIPTDQVPTERRAMMPVYAMQEKPAAGAMLKVTQNGVTEQYKLDDQGRIPEKPE